MYKGSKVLCVIPARGGSKGVPGKNVKPLHGKPLIAYSIEAALAAETVDRVIVSTDDEDIASVSREWGAEVPFVRPAELATDSASTIDVLLHAMDWAEADGYAFDVLLLLHATTPLRAVSDIDEVVRTLVDTGAESVFTVAEAYRNPYFNMVELDADGYAHLVKAGSFSTRQAAPPVYDLNSSIYAWPPAVLREKRRVVLERSRVVVMPRERSVDIDEPLDWRIAELLLAGAPWRGDGR
ncbi:MAG: acylneuraminate cytidylyltransferase family protein [Coriobacteriia bacterium]